MTIRMLKMLLAKQVCLCKQDKNMWQEQVICNPIF